MKKRTKRKIAAGCLTAAMAWQGLMGSAAVWGEEPAGQVTLEKTAHWVDEENYRAEIDLTVKGIEEYTASQEPVNIIPVLDVTASMDYCDTPGHTQNIIGHSISVMENAQEVWDQILPTLPDVETYRQMGEQDPNQLFLTLPESIDPTGKCRLVCRDYAPNNDQPFEKMGGWRIVYVTDDQTLLPGVKEDAQVGNFSHTIDYGGIYLPVGEMTVLENRVVWSYMSGKSQRYGCEGSRMDHLKEGYTQFLDAVFQDMQPQICPVAFIGGYYINGWTQSREEAEDFILNENYLNQEAVMPAKNNGTNHEAAVLGALDAVERLENTENTFVIVFTDGTTTAGYSHTEEGPDPGLLDSHSYGMDEADSSWYGQFSQWALEDAKTLKEQVPVYAVGYGSEIKANADSQEFIKNLSSGDEYYIDTRREDMQDIGSIFKAIYSDLCWKAVKVKVVDYISEYWDVVEEELPMGCTVEKVDIVNQKGEEDTITKLTFPVTREMGADDQEAFQIPVVLREAYRDVQQPTLYETNQDDPFAKDVEGTGAFVTYEDKNGEEQKVSVPTPELTVYPNFADYTLEKEALEGQVKAGEKALYELTLVNTGGRDLKDITLSDLFEEEQIPVTFLEQEGLEVSEDGAQAVLDILPRGEEVSVQVQAQIPEDAQGTLTNQASAVAPDPMNPGQNIQREDQAEIQVEPAKLDYTVEKTADKTQAKGGDTIHYEIQIVNTGERTLHSVVTTDQFTTEGVQAVFEEQEGVSLNEEKNQAYVEAVKPGEELTLKAAVTLPEDFADEELVNMAIVSVDGMDPKEDEAAVAIGEQPAPTLSPEPNPTSKPTAAASSSPKGSAGSTAKSGGSSSEKGSSVKTGDESMTELFCLAAGGSLLVIGGIFLSRRNRKVEK